MTKDNFCVGEFELTGLESAPRGVSQIEIIFSIDVNGIINISALDLKNVDNKKTISINSNKGRLSSEKIKELIEEAKFSEAKDKLEKEKKQLFYELEDLCSNIKINVNNEDFMLKEKDRMFVMSDVDKIFEWLKEKDYCDRNRKEFINILSKVKKKYGTLILKSTYDQDKVKAASDELSKIEATTIFGNEDEEKTIYEELENEELGIKDVKDEEVKKEIRRLREILINLCDSVLEIVSCDCFKINTESVVDLKDCINDTLLWVHVREKISITEYNQKIDDINKTCNEIIEKYNDQQIFEQNTISKNTHIKKSELEQLCYALLSSILSNMIVLEASNLEKLKDKVNETLDWLISVDIEIKKTNIDNEKHYLDEDIYQNKIDELNEMCNSLYSSMLNINIHNGSDLLNESDQNSNK
jgi:hypothetical protein